jgi:hypothetical protein
MIRTASRASPRIACSFHSWQEVTALMASVSSQADRGEPQEVWKVLADERCDGGTPPGCASG